MNVEFCEDNSSTSKKMRYSCFMLKIEMTLHFLSGITFIRHAKKKNGHLRNDTLINVHKARNQYY